MEEECRNKIARQRSGEAYGYPPAQRSWILSCNLFFRYEFGAKSCRPEHLEGITRLALADLLDEYPVLGGRAYTRQVAVTSADCLAGPLSTLWRTVKRKLLRTADIDLVVHATGSEPSPTALPTAQKSEPETRSGAGFLLFDELDDAKINGQTLRDLMDERVGITRDAFLQATSSKQDPGGFFPYQSLDAVDKPEIPLCYCILGVTKEKKHWGLTLLVNHYVSDGSSYFRVLQSFEQFFAKHLAAAKTARSVTSTSGVSSRGAAGIAKADSLEGTANLFSCYPAGNVLAAQWELESATAPGDGLWCPVARDAELLADLVQTVARDPAHYNVIKVILSDKDLAKIKSAVMKEFMAENSQKYALDGAGGKPNPPICSTNDAIFEFSCRASEKFPDLVATRRVAFPMDLRGGKKFPATMMGNGTTTISANLPTSGRAMSYADVRGAINSQPQHRASWLDVVRNALFLAVTDRLRSASPSAGSKNEGGPLAQILSVLKSLLLFILPARLYMSHQHVSWAKVQHMPKTIGDFVCQKTIGLDEDTRINLRKVMHHGSLMVQLTDDQYLFRFCHRQEVVAELVGKFKSLLGEDLKFTME